MGGWGREGAILTLSYSKLNFSFLSRHSLLTPKAKAEAGGILLGGKAQGVTFGLGGASLRRSPLASRAQSAPGWGRLRSAGRASGWVHPEAGHRQGPQLPVVGLGGKGRSPEDASRRAPPSPAPPTADP